jgi:hypothetical protein
MNFWESKLNLIHLCPNINILMGYKYQVDHEYFRQIDSEYKSYILGLLYADGTVIQPIGNRQMYVRIDLQEEDRYILEKFAREAGGREVSIIHRPSSIKNNWKKKAQITITSNQICKTLINYGCNINKSKVGITFPELDKDLIPHFIRGFMDGNGSIIIKKLGYNYKRKTTGVIANAHIQRYKLKIAFCSTDKVFLEKIIEYLPIKKSYLTKKDGNMILYILWVENPEDVQSTLTYLYKNAIYFLKRKHDKLEEFDKTIKSQATDTSVEGLETT